MSQLRIRDNGTIKALNIPEDKLQYLREVVKSEKIVSWKKEAIMKKIIGCCCICGDVPSMMVSYDMQGATKIEKYCDKCVKSLYAREEVL